MRALSAALKSSVGQVASGHQCLRRRSLHRRRVGSRYRRLKTHRRLAEPAAQSRHPRQTVVLAV